MSIDNLEKKINSELPVTREELIELINSWGRRLGFYTKDSQNKDIYIESCEATQSEQALLVRKECYNLSKLDTSEITDMSQLFYYSEFNGDISNWNMSNVTDMTCMFSGAKNFNGDIGNWDISKVTDMTRLFNGATIFNQDISNWDVSNVTSMISMFFSAKNFNQPLNFDTSSVTNMSYMFCNAEAFKDKYNNRIPLPYKTNEIKEWFNNNRNRMNDIDIKDKYGEEVDDFFSNITDIYSTNRIGLHENLLTECNKLFYK